MHWQYNKIIIARKILIFFYIDHWSIKTKFFSLVVIFPRRFQQQQGDNSYQHPLSSFFQRVPKASSLVTRFQPAIQLSRLITGYWSNWERSSRTKSCVLSGWQWGGGGGWPSSIVCDPCGTYPRAEPFISNELEFIG